MLKSVLVPERADLGIEMADLRPQGEGGQTDRQMDGRTYGRTSGNSPLCPTGHRPFGAAAQKASKMLVFPTFRLMSTDQQTDQWTVGRPKPLTELRVRN